MTDYPHEWLWKVSKIAAMEAIYTRSPRYFALVELCFAFITLLFEMIIPMFFGLWVDYAKSDWPILDPILMFAWQCVGYMSLAVFALGWFDWIAWRIYYVR